MTDKVRVAVFVSGGGTNLQAIIDAVKSGVISSAVLCEVISGNENAYALTRAENAGIRTAVIARKSFADQAAYEDALNAELKAVGAELIVLAGFLSILSGDFTALYPNRIINVHPALIPKFCGKGYYGLRVHEAVLAAKETVTGATVHYVNEVPDGGEIIFQKEVAVHPDDTPQILQRRVMEEAEWIILPEAVESVAKKILEKRL